MTNTDKNPARPGRRNNVPGPDAAAGPDSFDVSRAETQSDFIIVYGPDRKILYVNPAFAGAMGYGAERMTGTPLLVHIAEEFRETMAANLTALLETSEPPFYETVLVSKDGLRRSVIVKGRPVLYNNQPAALVFLIDMTERKALEDLLRARMEEIRQTSTSLLLANKKLNLLSSITRHDINNQLTSLETEQSDPALAVYCQNALTAAEQIAAMIRFTSEYEKIGISAPVWLDCRGIVDMAASHAALLKVVVHNDLPAGMEMYADPLVVKVFYNLMDNAVRYGRKITAIQFFLSEEDGKVIIVCEDDGDGVASCDKERIFDRGFGKNTGLGLALSREILDITGITIQETGTPGAGARFEITVPAGSCRFIGAQ